MIKFLFVGADKNNSTDGVIVQGMYKIIKKLKLNETSFYYFLNDAELLTAGDFPTEHYDFIVICGTPWLWDQFHKSVKFSNLLKILQYHEHAKKFFMGIGSCIGLDHIDSNICETHEEQEGMQKLFGKACVIARDKLCQYKLGKAGIKSYFLPCPSYFCYGFDSYNFEENYQNTMVWCDPQKTISSVDWQIPQKLQRYYEIFLEFNKNYNPQIFCALENEKDTAKKIGLPEPKILKGWQETLSIMQKSNYVLSGRVHCAVPSFTSGKKTCIVPIDSRSNTLTDFGCRSASDVKYLKFTNQQLDLKFYFETYINIISAFI
jgi:hypothetical protein